MSEPPHNHNSPPGHTPVRELALLFVKLGTISFGGPAASIALMEDEVVRRRGWLSRTEFLDLLGATNLIPGPNSTEMAIHIGYQRARWRGLLAAGACFILPAAFIVLAFAWAYVRYGSLPQASAILYGIKPVIIAVVLQALWRLGRAALKTADLAAVAIAGIVLSILGVNELIVLFGSGALMVLWRRIRAGGSGRFSVTSFLSGSAFALAQPAAGGGLAAAAAFGMWPLFLFFLKVGSVLFGSGYLLLVFLRADLVEHWRWMTESQLLDAIAVGQLTPGPVFTTATFIGYVLGGTAGAVVATAGIFLPAFIFVAISGPLVPRLRQSITAAVFLDGVNAASVALMAVVTGLLARTAIVDFTTVALSLVSLFLFIRYRVNSAWLVLAGAIVGFLAYVF